MVGDACAEACPHRTVPRWLVYTLVVGFYLTLRGYHSFDGDQAYRLPLLLHRQNPQLYADDPFVQAFDEFNPHRGALFVLDAMSRPFGLSAGLFGLFVFTFVATCLGFERLARCASPRAGRNAGLVAVGLLLAAKAGNIGTNHLFEAMVLDRLIAFALGWVALACTVTDLPRQRWWSPAAIGIATLVHPSVGLQLAMLLCACWATWSMFGRWTGIRWPSAMGGITGLMAAVLPGLATNLASRASVMSGMPADGFWLLSVELQGPQHMLPHLWRMPQWLAWSSYIALAGLACMTRNTRPAPNHESGSTEESWPLARLRLVIALTIILAGLGLAWCFIEIRHDVQVTVFQPFRMATVARGIALLLVSGRLVAFWQSGSWLPRTRAILIAVGFIGDWLLVVVTLSELVVSSVEAIRSRVPWFRSWTVVDGVAWAVMLALGLNFLGHHDTEYGHIPLLLSLGAGLLVGILGHRRRSNSTCRLWRVEWTALRLAGVFAMAWLVPLAALLAAAIPWDHPWSRSALVTGLLNRCRFIDVPVDDVERLAVWCRENTPATARFIGPPGPKTFRLWSQRNLAFNRAASPYHAGGLADWYTRFQDHVDFHVAPAEFVQAYVRERHRFEARYQALTDTQRAALAVRQGATYVVAAAPGAPSHEKDGASHLELTTDLHGDGDGPLELLHSEGRYAVYRVKLGALVQRQE
jgi:hypothetical protein